jgi:hypothetical protein
MNSTSRPPIKPRSPVSSTLGIAANQANQPMTANDPITKLKGLSDHFSERKLRAKERLETDNQVGWYFGIIGLQLSASSYDFLSGVAKIEEVIEPPGEIELASSLNEQSLFSAIARYSYGIRHQLKIVEHGVKEQKNFDLAWWITSLLRVRTLAEFLVPVASDHSWSVISGLEPRTCHVQFIEDVPRAKKLAESVVVQESDLEWVSTNVLRFARLLETPCFRLAVESLCTHQHQASDRMMVATLWAGIEALFNIHSELSFRLSTYVAVIIEPPGSGRRVAYQELKKLYGTRSKAVHGAKMSSEQIHEHVRAVRKILSRILCRFIEEDQVFPEERIEDEIFGILGSSLNA